MMKRHFRSLFAAAMMLAITTPALQAASKKVINFKVGPNIEVSSGIRRAALDAVVFKGDSTELESGLSLTDFLFTIEAKFKENLRFKMDIDINDKIGRDLFIEYAKGANTIKGGFFRDPSSMSMNTEMLEYRFITRPSTTDALMNFNRVFGLSYKYTNEAIFAEQAIYTTEGPSSVKLQTKFQNMGAAGRWLYKTSLGSGTKLHAGINARFTNYSEPKNIILDGALENNVVKDVNFLSAAVPYVKNDISVGAEALYMGQKYFVRGEYTQRMLTKERDDAALFAAQTSYTDLAGWQLANPIRTNNFAGAYVEGAYLVKGDRYTYNENAGYVDATGMKGAIEVVGRYSYTNMNDITKGDIFSIDRFHQNGNPYDFASQSSSIGGGEMHAALVGANYYLTNTTIIMANYTYSMVNNPYFPDDKNISLVQLRIMLSF